MEIKFFGKTQNVMDYLIKSTEGASAYDVLLQDDLIISPMESLLVHLKFAIHIKEPNLGAIILPRGSMSALYGIALANTVGIIDQDYQDELAIVIVNHSKIYRDLRAGVPIVQIVFVHVYTDLNFQPVQHFTSESKRRTANFPMADGIVISKPRRYKQ